ncbi:MAG: hypothetical protein K2W82_17800 [Candidatus Obscuribacterales bacterium]|nr:hypothetical protein [Candidatus Obscuribacterales bacterium]
MQTKHVLVVVAILVGIAFLLSRSSSNSTSQTGEQFKDYPSLKAILSEQCDKLVASLNTAEAVAVKGKLSTLVASLQSLEDQYAKVKDDSDQTTAIGNKYAETVIEIQQTIAPLLEEVSAQLYVVNMTLAAMNQVDHVRLTITDKEEIAKLVKPVSDVYAHFGEDLFVIIPVVRLGDTALAARVQSGEKATEAMKLEEYAKASLVVLKEKTTNK